MTLDQYIRNLLDNDHEIQSLYFKGNTVKIKRSEKEYTIQHDYPQQEFYKFIDYLLKSVDRNSTFNACNPYFIARTNQLMITAIHHRLSNQGLTTLQIQKL